MATETKSNVVKGKPISNSTGNQVGPSSISSSSSSKRKVDSSVIKKRVVESSSKQSSDSPVIKKKVVESSSKQSSDSKQKSASTTSSKTEVKAKGISSSSKTVTKTVTKGREKKVYSLPGQKFDIPEEREPLRIFYESLSKQIPSSEMAEFWMMEHGLLSPERAKKAFEKKQRKQKQLRTGTPIKSPPAARPSKAESSRKPQQVSKNGEVKAKKRIIDDSDDDDFVFSNKRRKG